MERTTFVGLDVSKQTIAVAVASDEAREPTRYLGRFANTPDPLRTLAKNPEGPHAIRVHLQIWTDEPERFTLNPIHQMPGLNILACSFEQISSDP